ncbi:hypothetical protein BJ973_008003 [Actinoplanes tereljensis]
MNPTSDIDEAHQLPSRNNLGLFGHGNP